MYRQLTPHWLRAACALLLFALATFAGAARAQDEFLDPAVAFRFSASMQDPQTIAVTWEIADKYYMYRERFAFRAEGATLGEPVYPKGKVKYDPTFEKDVETYSRRVNVTIPVRANGPFTLIATAQGCADAGLCYPPQEQRVRLSPAGLAPGGSTPLANGGAGSAFRVSPPAAQQAGARVAVRQVPAPETTILPPPVPQPAAAQAPALQEDADAPARIERVLAGGSLAAIVPAFILLGLGLAFTPCVLPMVPILSSIIVGEGARSSRSRGLLLSASYSLGMALVYTALGVAAGLAGEGLAAALQNPWVLGAFALLMVAMSLSMFGLYQLQLPAALQTRLAAVSGRQQGGKLAGVFAMGAISALIVGPCVAAPLAGALVYISHTRDVVVGGSALFSMAAGMSLPLLLVGVSAGSLLPRAGVWMESVKRAFGVLMLAMALWLVSPVLPAAWQMAGWAALLLGYGFYLLRHGGHWAGMAVGGVLAILGAMQVVGLASGGRDPLAPLGHLRGGGTAEHVQFRRIKGSAALDAELARLGGRPALLDFYADWCVSCKEMEKLTFTDERVRQRMGELVLLQVDVTANDEQDKALLRRFGLFGPPAIIMFDGAGREVPGSRVIGYQSADKFLRSLEKLRPAAL